MGERMVENEIVPVDKDSSKVLLVLSDLHVQNYMESASKLTDSFQKWLVPEVDYTTKLFGRGRKPTLLDPGAGKLIGFFQCRPKHRILERFYSKDEEGFETIRYILAAELIFEKLGIVVAEGVGSCTSDEVRYKYRWYYSSELRNMGYKENEIKALPQRKRGQSPVFRARNPEIPDLDNTIFKMAAKRAEVDAALQLPGVAAVFTQDIGTAKTSYQEPSEEEIKIKEQAKRDRTKKKDREMERPTSEKTPDISQAIEPETESEEEKPPDVSDWSVDSVRKKLEHHILGLDEWIVVSSRPNFIRVGKHKKIDDEMNYMVSELVKQMGGKWNNDKNEWQILKEVKG